MFWLVNLYSLFVNIEHNGDESTKGNTVLYLLKCEVSKHMYFVCYKVVTNLCYMSSTLLSSKHENLLLQLHNFLSFLDWYSNNANFIMLLLQTFNWFNQCCWLWSGRPAGWPDHDHLQNEKYFGQRLYRKTLILFSIKLFSENRPFYDIMWTSIEQPDRQQMTIWHMRIVRWIPKVTNTISEYAILIAFLLQKSLHARASKSRDTHISCLFSLCINSQVQWALVLTLRLLMQVLLMLLILLMQVSSLRPLTCWDRGF